MNKKRVRRESKNRGIASASLQIYELEILPGLKPLAKRELNTRLGSAISLIPTKRSDQLIFSYTHDLRELFQLKMAVAVYWVEQFAIPRPKALLGQQNLTRLLTRIDTVLTLHPAHSFRTFRFSAAGKDSAIFRRLKDEIAHHTHLTYVDDEADLFIRVRRGVLHPKGWEVLLRLTPRPLATRMWRVVDMPGALNGSIAAAMVELSRPNKQDQFLNLMSGSGTLLIERLQCAPVSLAVGGDNSRQALAAAQKNLAAAHLPTTPSLLRLDATHTPFPTAAFHIICADLPWGQLTGTHAHNAALYPAVLAEAARLTCPGGRFILLTHEISLLERILPDFSWAWRLEQSIQVYQGGLHPKIFVLVRSGIQSGDKEEKNAG